MLNLNFESPFTETLSTRQRFASVAKIEPFLCRCGLHCGTVPIFSFLCRLALATKDKVTALSEREGEIGGGGWGGGGGRSTKCRRAKSS